MTILMAVVLLSLMWLIKRVLKPVMYKAGKDNQDYYSGLFKWISQTVQGIKEVKISGKEQYFVSEYRKCGKGYVDAVQRYSLYNQVPKLLIETACVAYRKYADSVRNSGGSGTGTVALREPYQQPDQFHRLF